MSVRRDNRGRWFYRKWVRHPDGRRERICGYPKNNTKAAAEHAERIHIMRIENPSAVPAAPAAPDKEVQTVREYTRTFLAGYAGSHKPSEVDGKRRIINAHVLPWFGERRLDDIRQIDVDAWVADLLKGGRERKTVNNITSVLSSLLKYAARNHERPPVDLTFAIEADESDLVALEPAQVNALLESAGDPRYAAAILLAADGGLRIGEIRALEHGDINELRRSMTISRSIDPANRMTATKNRKRRTVPLTERLRVALKEVPRRGRYVVSRRDGQALGYYAMRERLHRIYLSAGVEAPPKPWHCLRHTFCTELARAGVPIHVIKELAGHASIQTTLRYMHTSETDKRAAVASIGQQVGSKAVRWTSEKTKSKRM